MLQKAGSGVRCAKSWLTLHSSWNKPTGDLDYKELLVTLAVSGMPICLHTLSKAVCSDRLVTNTSV